MPAEDGLCLALEHGPGLRVAVKDLFDMAGLPTVAGSRAVDAQPAERDADCLAGIREHAVVVGRTSMHELAFGVTGVNAWQGTPLNPLDAALVPGGSSSGAAVAVATGVADVALGTDTGGSVRIPAACCGVAGLKTTWGRVSTRGVWPLAPRFDTVGPLARTVAGLADGMRLLGPLGEAEPATRVGRVRLACAFGVDDALDRALAPLEQVPVELLGWDTASSACLTLLSAEAFATVGHLLATGRVGEDVAGRLARGADVSPARLQHAEDVCVAWTTELLGALARTPVLALPTLSDAAPRLDDADRMYDLRLTLPVNLAGVPALSLPVPRRDGPPASLQLVAAPGGEELLLATAAVLEAALPSP